MTGSGVGTGEIRNGGRSREKVREVCVFYKNPDHYEGSNWSDTVNFPISVRIERWGEK